MVSYKFSDYIVSRTKNPLVYEIMKTKVDIKRRNKDNQLHKILTTDDADILLSFNDKRNYYLKQTKN